LVPFRGPPLTPCSNDQIESRQARTGETYFPVIHHPASRQHSSSTIRTNLESQLRVMAGTNNQFNQIQSLSSNQQDLLLAALSSNNPNSKKSPPSATQSSNNQFSSFNDMDPAIFSMNGQSGMPLGSFDSPLGTIDDSPYVDFLDGTDPNFNFDFSAEDGQMIGDLPGADELHDKRKSPEDSNEENTHDDKRREGEEKTAAKKPGRKPLTSEPTSVRGKQILYLILILIWR
jgi:AP-1-like factor